MEHTQHANHLAAQDNVSGTPRQEGRVVARNKAVVRLRHPKHQHRAVQKPVDLLEARGGTGVDGNEPALVASSNVGRVIQEDDVRHLKQLDGDGRTLVVVECLEHAWQERGSHNLELDGLGVGEHNGGLAVVRAAQLGERLVVAAQGKSHSFAVTCHSDLLPQLVRETIDWLLLGHGCRLGQAAGDIVVAVSNSHVLSNVAGLQHVAASGWRGHADRFRGSIVHRVECHLLQQLHNRGGLQSQGGESFDECQRRFDGAGRKVGERLLGGGGVGVGHVDLLHSEGLVAVLGKHGDHGVEDGLGLGEIGRRALDEDVLGFVRDLRVVSINDRGERQNTALGVKDDGVDRRAANDIQKLLQLGVGLVEGHQLLAIELLVLVQRLELDVLGGEGFV
mmetsp:Transcript_345/g.961  ORF Transcript_345/g.961 Transcript_345/m.961 type:complete len:392 (+) Transcript_345:227-1402(+)